MKKKKKVDFKDSILNINLETQTAPIIQEAMGKDYIEYGTEDYRNTYPQFLIDLYYNSSTHAAIVNATADMIAGESLTVEETDNLEAFVKLKKFIAQANGKGESLHSVIKKLAFDFKLQGGYAINVVWSKDRTTITDIYHIPVERIRVGKPDVTGRVTEYYVSADWSNTRKNKPQCIPAFNLNDRTSPNAIIYDGMYSPNMQLYKVPDYVAACNWCLIDQKVAEFHLANIENGFAGSYFISFANGVPTQEERRQIENSIVKKFSGSGNAGKFVLTFSDDKNRTPEITPIAVADADKQYLALQELLVQNILTGHRITSPMLVGIKNSTGLGNNAEELNSAFEVYLNSVIKPFQNNLLMCIGKILEVNDINLPISIEQLKPITSRFTIEDMKEVMTTDEIREELGLKPLEEGQDLKRQDYAKVGSIVTDGKELPLFDTIEEAEEEALRMGCKGYHEHTQDGKTYYMPCEDHEQTINLNDCGCKEEFISPNPCEEGYVPYGHKIKDGRKVPNCVPLEQAEELKKCDCDNPKGKCVDKCRKYEQTELDKFIEQYGEDEPNSDEWTLISDEKVEEEHEDFDFENELNDIANYEFATTGTARPNSRSEQDGLDRDFNLYKVRYEYETAIASPNTRNFCKKMLAAKKVYRKEDILQMSNKKVNDTYTNKDGRVVGWGPNGDATYSVWLYKGGGNCGHFWRRKIYFYKLGVATGNKIQDATDIVGTVEARSRGFYPKANDSRVARAPKNLPNNGFLN